MNQDSNNKIENTKASWKEMIFHKSFFILKVSKEHDKECFLCYKNSIYTTL